MNFVYQMVAQALGHLGDHGLLEVTWRTLRLALESTVLAALLGLPLGVRLGMTRWRPGLILANAGLGLPPVVLGVYLGLAFLPASFLGALQLTNTLTAVVIAQTLLALPIVIALTAAAIAGLPAGLLDQARAYGASGPRRAVLALREARVGVLAALIAAVGSALAEVGAVIIVGGNSPGYTNTLASTVLLQLSASEPAQATATIMILLTLVLAVGGALTYVQQRSP